MAHVYCFLTNCTADDNTLSFIHRQLAVLKSVVESGGEVALDWFDSNQILENFETIATGSRTHSELKSLNVVGNARAHPAISHYSHLLLKM